MQRAFGWMGPGSMPRGGTWRIAFWLGLPIVAAIVWLAYPQGWRHRSDSLALPGLQAELFFLNVPALVRAGPPRLAVVRIDGPARFEPHVFWHEQLDGPIPIEAWAKKLAAPVVFNAGQFDEKWRHLGWLKGRGQWLEPTRKMRFLGLLVSGPSAHGQKGALPLPRNRIIDLQLGEASAADEYDNVVQSMMLIDEQAQSRVRHTQVSACRTVVAEDDQHRMLVIVSEGAITLHDLASWLPHSGLHVVRAMNLDGGAESQLAVDSAKGHIVLSGRYGHERLMFARPQTAPTPLPAVIAVVADR